LLIKYGADINYKIDKDMDIFSYVRYNELFNHNKKVKLNKDMTKFILNNGFHRSNFVSKTFEYILYDNEEDNIKILEIIFKHFSYDISSILDILFIYKNDQAASNETLENLKNKTKNVFKIKDTFYDYVIEKKYYKALNVLFKYDANSKEIMLDNINKFNLLDIALQQNDKEFLMNILSYMVLDIEKIKFEIYMKEIIEKNYKEDIVLLFINTLIQEQFNIKSINFENLLLEASRKENIDIMKILLQLFLKTYTLHKGKYVLSRLKELDKPYLTLILNIAIKINDIKIVKYLIEDRILKTIININSKDKNNEYPIFAAYYSSKYYAKKYPSDNIKIFEYLLKKNIDINVNNKNNDSLICLALKEKEYEILKYLFKRSLPVHEEDISNKSHPLLRAVCQNNIKGVQSIMNKFEIKNNDEDISNKNISLLRTMYQYNIEEFESTMNNFKIEDINNWFNIHRKTDFIYEIHSKDNFNPFTLSYLLNYEEILKILINVDIISFPDNNYYTLLQYAILKEDVSMVQQLIHMGIDQTFGDIRYSPLDICIKIKNKEIFSILLNCNNEYLTTNLNESEESILITLINSNFPIEDKIELIQMLLNKGYKVEFINGRDDCEDDFILNYAIRKGEFPVVQFLIEHGAFVGEEYTYSNSPLKTAIEHDSIPIIKLLLERNAEINDGDNNDIPLYHVIEKNNENSFKIVKLLVKYGAEIDYGILEYSICNDSLQIFKLLFDRFIINNYEEKDTIIETFVQQAIENKKINFIKHIFDIYINDEKKYKRFYELINVLDYDIKMNLLGWLVKNKIDFFTVDIIKELIRESYIDIIKILIEYQFNFNIKDHNGDTPIYFAYLFNEKEIMNYLISSGANIDSINSKNKSFDNINKRYHYKSNPLIYTPIKRLKTDK